jgi:hypothetical protein
VDRSVEAGEMVKIPSVDKFVAKLNVEHFREKLATEVDEAKRRTLMTLLAEEEAKLAALEDGPAGEERKRRG